MPSKNKRVNLTVSDSLLSDLVLFQMHLHRKFFWEHYSLAATCIWIIRSYLREHDEWRAGSIK